MFAEELKGNASRKRQEEARARRRQLKQQQEKTQQRRAETATSTGISSPRTQAPNPSLQPDPTILAAIETTVKPSVVAVALEQRQLRQEQQHSKRSAITIQSVYRSHQSNCHLLTAQASQLSQRLKDLSTLRVLILQKTATEYVPPPATATVLVRQLLFVTKSLSYKRKGSHTKLRSPEDVARLQQVLQYVLLPGILGKDDNLDPLLTWTEGEEGHIRLMELLRLCFVTATSRPAQSFETMSIIDSFLRAVIGIWGTARGVIVDQCRVILPTISSSAMTYSAPYDRTKKTVPPYAVTAFPLDTIGILRYHLLFASGDPIPSDAAKRREACIAAKDRGQNDVLFQLAIDAVQSTSAESERRRLHSRFVAEILTVPLLTWKVSAACISRLLAVDNLAAAQPPVIMVMLASFVELHSSSLSAGNVVSILPTVDVPMTSCPATSVQCLLANLVQIGRICPSINGSDASKIDYQGAYIVRKVSNLTIFILKYKFGSKFSSRRSLFQLSRYLDRRCSPRYFLVTRVGS